MNDSDFLPFLKSMLARSAMKMRFGGLLIVGVGALMIWLSFIDQTMTTVAVVGAWIFGGVFVATGVLILYVSFKPNPVVQALEQSPGSVVWLYRQDVVTQYGKRTNTSNVFIGFSDGKRHNILCNAAQADKLLEALHARLPKAVLGYNKAIEEQFKRDPGSVIRL